MHAERNWNSLRKFCLYHTHFLARSSCIWVTVQLIMIEPIDADWSSSDIGRRRLAAALSLAYAIGAIWAHLHGHWAGTHTHTRTHRVISLWPAVCVQRGKRLSNGVWRLVGQSVNCISWPSHASSSSSSSLLMNIIIIIIITSLRL